MSLLDKDRAVPNYGLALKMSVELLEDVGINSLPILVQAIISSISRTVQLTSYGEFSASTGLSHEEIADNFKSDDGVCVYKRDSEQYVIFYNEKKDDNRFRFTIAHELGHIYLEHHRIAGSDILTRSELTSAQYERYEKEANCFARNLLSPAPLAKTIKNFDETGLYTLGNFQDEFYIGYQASRFRLGFLEWDLNNCTDEMISFIGETFPEYKMYCRNCKSELIHSSKYCIMCGENRRFLRSYQYKKLSYTDNHAKNHSEKCLNCNNSLITDNASYCRICGYTLLNKCINPECSSINIPIAHYCNDCGSETIFKSKLEEIDNLKEGPTLYYKDGVEFDKQTYKVKICPRCHNEEFSEDAEHCRICSLYLFNNCEGYLDEDEWGNQALVEQHANPSNARFCETCGRITAFYKAGVLTDYQSYTIREELPF